MYVHEDADRILDDLGEKRGQSRTEVLEHAIYTAWFFDQAIARGEKVLLFDPKNDPPYREVILSVRHQSL